MSATQSGINQKEYLKKYLGIGKGSGDKKKKKTKKLGPGLKIVDDDIDARLNEEIQVDLTADNDEAPQIVSVIDDRPPSLRIDEETRSKLWKPIGAPEESEQVDKSIKFEGNIKLSNLGIQKGTALKNKRKFSPDKKHKASEQNLSSKGNSVSPLRQYKDKDVSPPRRERTHNDSDPDNSPPRRRDRDNDNSPPRKRKDGEDFLPHRRRRSRDMSPPKQSKIDSDSSPPRRKKARAQDLSPSKKRGNPDADTSPPRIKKENSEDNSPPRRSRIYRDLSPPRKRKYGEDSSPLRRRHSKGHSDSSPRRSKVKSQDLSSPRRGRISEDDFSPPTRIKKERSVDITPSRKVKYSEDSSPPRAKHSKENSDPSPPRTSKAESKAKTQDLTPPQRGRITEDHSSSQSRIKKEKDVVSSPPRKRKADRKSRWGDSEDSSEKMQKTLDGKTAGLQNAAELVKETEELKKREDELFKKLSSEVSGANAATVVRRKNKDVDPEEEERKRKIDEENKQKYSRWGKGLKQVEDINEKLKSDLHEMSKPLARYADDEDLERHLKEQEREGDPMLAYLRQKKREKAVDEGKPVIQQFEGDAPPNRFGIRPGYRWDGVDRSNGYERKWFEVQNSRKASMEESYKWNTEDM